MARWREEHWRSRARLDLAGAYLSGARLRSADLAHDNLASIDLTSADLRRANLAGASLNSAYLSRASLAWANLTQAILYGAALNRADLSGASLQGADLRGVDLSFANLSAANLAEANLSGADLREANLAMADLTRASLTDARLTATQLEVANLAGADLRRASLIRPRLQATILAEVALEMTLFGDCDLGQVLGLESARHFGPSIIGSDTLIRSGGAIPDAFLRRAGVPDEMIAMQRQLSPPRRQLAKILLVGSVNDREFTAQLEDSLRDSGLACWSLAVDDETIFGVDERESLLGRFIYYDQLLLICSEASLGSPYGWRSFEQIVRDQESRRRAGGLLVAVNLDRRLFDGQDPLGAEIVQGKVVDFRQWPDSAAYTQALAALIEALTEGPAITGFEPPPEPIAPPGD